MLSPEASAEYGRWKTARAEYQRGIMDAFSDPSVETVVVQTSAQVGKTECLQNVIGYFIDYSPSPILIVEPTIEVGKTFSKDRLSTMIRDSPCLLRKVREIKTRDSENTILHKRFPGGHITIAGANSPASLRARPIRVVMCDDVDAFPPSAGAEGDPIDLAIKRTTTFWNRKIGIFSTPTMEGESRIDTAFKQSDQRLYWVSCPHCGKEQILKWKRVRWPEGKPEEAVYRCEHCEKDIDDAGRSRMIRDGKWVPQAKFTGIAGFWLNEIYSPWVPLASMATRFLQAKDNRETLQVFVNTALGETFKQVIVAGSEEGILKARCDLPPQVVPETAVGLTCGIDVQKYGFWFVVRAWARDYTSWLIHYGSLTTWEEVENLLFETSYPYQNNPGKMLRIGRTAVDTGGGGKYEDFSMTEETYWWLVQNMGRGLSIWGTKGSSHPIPGRFKKGPPLLKTPSGKPLPHWFCIISIDTARMKDGYHYAIDQAVKGQPRAAYLHSGVGRDYALQIMAEEKRLSKTGAFEWVQVKADNHLFDAEVLCMSVAHPDWMGGGVNLIRGSGAVVSAGSFAQAPVARRRVISQGVM